MEKIYNNTFFQYQNFKEINVYNKQFSLSPVPELKLIVQSIT